MKKQTLDLEKFQAEVEEWGKKNFPDSCWQMCVMGVTEEMGELNHALLKQWQGIRGTHEEHEKLAKDAVGDIVIFLTHLCIKRGWNLSEIVAKTWAEVSQRDWIENPSCGESLTTGS
jgi:NTP pyrophosphatase (non-canonical NTP hydrolase)